MRPPSLPRWRSVSARSDVPAEKVLAQVVDSVFLSGAAKLDLVVAGEGRNAQEVLKTLDGKVDVTIEKGRLIGFNLRRALLEWWRSWSYDPQQRTSFDKISGNYGIKDGVVRTLGDLSLTWTRNRDHLEWDHYPALTDPRSKSPPQSLSPTPAPGCAPARGR